MQCSNTAALSQHEHEEYVNEKARRAFESSQHYQDLMDAEIMKLSKNSDDSLWDALAMTTDMREIMSMIFAGDELGAANAIKRNIRTYHKEMVEDAAFAAWGEMYE